MNKYFNKIYKVSHQRNISLNDQQLNHTQNTHTRNSSTLIMLPQPYHPKNTITFPEVQRSKRFSREQCHKYNTKLENYQKHFSPSRCSKSIRLEKVRLQRLNDIKIPSKWQTLDYLSELRNKAMYQKKSKELQNDSNQFMAKKRKKMMTQEISTKERFYERIIF